MNSATAFQIIQVIITPVVMVSACAILASGMLQRYAAINDRVRVMNRERFDLLRAAGAQPNSAPAHPDVWTMERLAEIDEQVPLLLHRHSLIHLGLMALYTAIIVFIVTMLLIAIALKWHSSLTNVLVVVSFLIGVALVLVAALFMLIEVRSSQLTLQYEAHRIANLGKPSLAGKADGSRE